MAFEKTVPEWNAAGSEPPIYLVDNGFTPGYKPPAAYFNWFWHTVSECLAELYAKGFNKYAINIAADGNMDDCTEVGFYTYSMSASATIKNAPEQAQATVLVLPRLMNNNEENLVQVVVTSANNVYVRNRSDSTWNGWRKFFKDDSVIPVENGGTGAKTAAAALTKLGAAPASHGRHVPTTCVTVEDWNGAVETGWYMASGAKNAPTDGAWYFGYVIAHNSNYVLQEVYQFTSSSDAKYVPKYIRAKMNGNWGDWTEVTVQRTLPIDAVTYGTADITAGTSPLGTGKMYLVYE